ncbi:cysteine desulfurase [Candidatus Blochmanniella vafra str. BVAF]|uniref:Cysteine desulfurase n=1 Tax=Blochmanniella vafra (strain BVAF) TaxID=859654 RepID=E8Q665_BLOVB|nr:SufS family cysteine desulfurase [Candidatus Blochmannia vafer]ADV33759.1 cysteine desulfurase [Candidatus Blochmannia vafer str. BVAF]
MTVDYPIKKIRSNFPILNKMINKYPLTYLDNAATTQKPDVVIESQAYYYRNECSSAHRSVHSLSTLSTDYMEKTRLYVANFINASKSEEIVFVKGTTDAINLIANSWGRNFINYGDNILISEMEHHSNILPWQILAKEKNIKLNYIPLLYDGSLNLTKLSTLIDHRTRLVSITHMSNVVGIINPLIEIINIVHTKSNAIILIDGAQGIAHQLVDVQKLNCDFYVFSGHKIYAPSGIGIMYGKSELLKKMKPWIVGGGIVKDVSLTQNATFIDSPWKFESGSSNVSGIVALRNAIKYVNSIGIENIFRHETQLMSYTRHMLLKKNLNLMLYNKNNKSSSMIAFNFKLHNSYDIGTLLNQYGIAIRTGHHCAIPLMNHFKVSGMCRASFAMYTNTEDIDRFIDGLIRIQNLFI